MGGMFFRFATGRSGASGANARYITRESATNSDEKNLITHNYPDYGQEGESYQECRSNVIAYCEQQEQDELSKPRRGGGETRTHYRAIASFEEKIDSEKAREMAKEYLKDNFGRERAIAVIHQDTDHTHVHFHVQARDIEGKKVRLDNNRYQALDKGWNKIYSREYGQEKGEMHLNKKMERQKDKISMGREIEEQRKIHPDSGKLDLTKMAREKVGPKPARVFYKSKEVFNRREDRNFGRYELDKSTNGRTDRSSLNSTTERASNEGSVGRGEQEISRFVERSKRSIEQGNRTEQAARGALSESQGLRDKSKERNHLERDLLKRLR